VERVRACVAGTAVVTDDDVPPGATEDERGTQASGSRPDHDGVKNVGSSDLPSGPQISCIDWYLGALGVASGVPTRAGETDYGSRLKVDQAS
jgi:hypothetical protein